MSYEQAKRGYANLWSKAEIRPERKAAALSVARKLLVNRARYEIIAAKIGCPWYFIAVVHNLEAGGRFDRYLGNGQRLSQVTTIKPKGRGPFRSFEEGAIDALRLEGVDKVRDWSIPHCLYLWESYNGFGYAQHNVNSPYVWSFTTLYTRGKYVEDEKYSATAVSQQCGAAAILKALIELGAVQTEQKDDDMATKELASSIQPFEGLVPNLVRTIAGPLPSLAVRALAEALGAPLNANSAAEVKSKLEAAPISELVGVLQKAEELVGMLTVPVLEETPAKAPVAAVEPVPAAAPVVVQPVEPVQPPSLFIDRFLPKGWKTIIGITVYCAGVILPTLGYVTPDTGTVIQTVGGGMVGITVKLMLDRWLPLFAGFLKRT